ncbi:MAG: shikimate kinase [Myxococcota bacterium]
MDDYYSPHPRVLLSRPILIGGQMGCGAPLVGRTLSARTGLPFVEVDRRIEHAAGASLAELAKRDGLASVARRARDVLLACALERPASIVVLDAAWPTAGVGRALGRSLDLVHVERSADYLLDRIEKEIHRVGLWRLGGHPFAFRNGGDLAAFQGDRIDLLARATVHYTAGHQHPLEVVDGLLESLEAIFGAKAI